MKFLLLVAGLCVILASVLADVIGYGDGIAFGQWQLCGTIIGLAGVTIWLILQVLGGRAAGPGAAARTAE